MQYALGEDAKTEPADGWSTSIPTGTDIGDYYVWYKAVGDDGICDSDAVCVKATIKVDYPLWVGDTQVTSANMGDVLENDPVNGGKVSFTPAAAGGASTPATLTLKGAIITKGHEVRKSGYPTFTCGIYYDGNGPLNVVLESGSDNILIGGDAFIHGLYSEKDLNISGAGAITISVKDIGVNAAGNIIIDGGTINASASGNTANCYGIYAQHDTKAITTKMIPPT